jgi:hypothetical protein
LGDFQRPCRCTARSEFVLALHDAGCVAEAIQDAIAHGIDDDYGARQGAAQLLEAGDIRCRCTSTAL